MFAHTLRKQRTRSSILAAAIAATSMLGAAPLLGSDHADTQILVANGRHDARISDLFAFRNGDNLVLIVCLNPAIGPKVLYYEFPTDVLVRLAIDVDSPVDFSNVDDLQKYGGTIVQPENILEDITIDIMFDADNQPLIIPTGMPTGALGRMQVFRGLRDDPFIRGPLIGRNISAIVLEMPLDDVLGSQDTLLIWATSAVNSMPGDFQEMAGRSLRSQLAENLNMNTLHPSEHMSHLGVPADVMIYDTSRPAAFPNGRRLTDDVVDLVGDPRLLNTDAPHPSANDKPFQAAFPYLAGPHIAPSIPAVSTWGILIMGLAFLVIAHLRFGRRAADAR